MSVIFCIAFVKNIQDGCERVRGWLCLRGPHNFIILGDPKDHNPALNTAVLWYN